MDRRTLLKTGSLFSIGLATGAFTTPRFAWASSQGLALAKFVSPLRRFGIDIPLAVPDGTAFGGATHYTISMEEIVDVLHPSMAAHGTRLWAYTNGANKKHLGAGIVAARGEKVQVSFINKLPGRHILPVDTTIPGANRGPNRTSVHLHGGKVPWTSDGGPHFWWSPSARGASFVDMLPHLGGNGASPNGQAELFYPNDQSARMMWFHDHALGITRLNAYAGLAAPYIITDTYETTLATSNYLPGPLDPRTVHLSFQDKVFVSSDIGVTDPTWAAVRPDSRVGDLWYPHVYDAAREAPAWPLPDPSVVPEMFGDTILVNGTVYPYLEVEQREYRFRMLNACNARFLNPRLVYARSGTPTEPDKNAAGPGFIQIGSEGGFLPFPAPVGATRRAPLLLAPGERADLIVDFRDVPAGSVLILYNDAPAPFPHGDASCDHYPQNPKTPGSAPGFGPNTRTLLQVRVKARIGVADPAIKLPSAFDTSQMDPYIVAQTPGVPTPIPAGMKVRRLTLVEDFDEYGRLIQLLGTDQAVSVGREEATFGRAYEDAPTEIMHAGATEVWEIANLTADTHPIHFHLVNVQVLSRQRFSDRTYPRGHSIPFTGFATIRYQGRPMAPEPNELGWKETVRMNPGEVTRVVMQFNLPAVGFSVPLSPRTGGNEYVWHCHILEHEEHDMMRPLIVN